MINSLIKECVGKIIKDVNTSIDVGLDQIEKEASKFNLNVDKNGIPRHQFFESTFPKKYELSNELLEYISENGYQKEIVNNNKLIYHNSEKRLIITTDKLTGSFSTYIRFCKDNPSLTSNIQVIKNSDYYYFYTEENEERYTYPIIYTEDLYEDISEELSNKIISAFNEYKETSNLENNEIGNLLSNLKFNNTSIKDMFLSQDNIKRSITTRGIIFVNCFEKINDKKPSISQYKQALKDNEYPEDLMKFLEQNNFTLEGEGVYGSVYSSSKDNIVIKIDKGKIDESYLRFANFCNKNKSKHLPKMGKIRKFKNYFVLPIEKLESSNKKDMEDVCLWCDKYIESKSVNDKVKVINSPLPGKYDGQQKGLADVLDDLHQIMNLQKDYFDLHPGNIMLRGNTIVFTDPLAMK